MKLIYYISCMKIAFALKKLVHILLFLFLVLLLPSCHKDLPIYANPQDSPGDNYTDLFDAFWNGMNANYVYWSIDTTQWDKMYVTYKPLFDQLTTFDSVSENKAEQYFNQMTRGLVDSHLTISYGATGRVVSPSQNRKLAIDPGYFSDSIFSRGLLNQVITKYYIDSSTLVMGTDNTSGGIGGGLTAISGVIHGDILYLYISSFSLSQAGQNTSMVLDYFFNTVQNLPPNIKAIILDLRGNPGGEVADMDYVLGRMITHPFTYGYTRTKNGIGRLDYSPWAPAVVNPWNAGTDIHASIIVLGDHGTTSLAELMGVAVQNLPNGKFIGTNTWGATGPVSPSLYYNGGSFSIGTSFWGANGYISVYSAAAMFKGTKNQIYEGVGVSPDIYSLETIQAYLNNHDLVLDSAISYVMSK